MTLSGMSGTQPVAGSRHTPHALCAPHALMVRAGAKQSARCSHHAAKELHTYPPPPATTPPTSHSKTAKHSKRGPESPSPHLTNTSTSYLVRLLMDEGVQMCIVLGLDALHSPPQAVPCCVWGGGGEAQGWWWVCIQVKHSNKVKQGGGGGGVGGGTGYNSLCLCLLQGIPTKTQTGAAPTRNRMKLTRSVTKQRLKK